MSNADLRSLARQSASRPRTERRCYTLPARLVEAILLHQITTGLPSETAAVRVLLGEALAAHEAKLDDLVCKAEAGA